MSNRNESSDAGKLVAIVVPLSLRADLTPDKEIPLRHLRHFLGRYDKYLVAPKSLGLTLPKGGTVIIRLLHWRIKSSFQIPTICGDLGGGDQAWVWKSFTRGLNPIYMDPFGRPGFPQANELVRKSMGYVLSYSQSI